MPFPLSTYLKPTPRCVAKNRGGLKGVEPVLLEDLKNYLRVSHEKDDKLIADLAVASREALEVKTNRSYVDSVIIEVWENVYDGFDFPDFFSEKTPLEVCVDYGEGFVEIKEAEYAFTNLEFKLVQPYKVVRVKVKYAESVIVPQLAKILIKRLTRWHYDNKGESVGSEPDWLHKEAAKLSKRRWF